MIARLRGRPVGRGADTIVLDVNGVGYLLATTPTVLRRAEEEDTELVVETYLHVREDTLQLYGFSDADERELFTKLLTVNGVGPKVALAVVSGSRPADLKRAIVLGDHARFLAIPGIGKKTAERIVLELRGSVDAEGAPAAPADGEAEIAARDALVGLGFSLLDAERALAEIDTDLPEAERVRLALRRVA